MVKSRPNFNRSFSNDPNSSSMFSHSVAPSEKPSFSSLFTGSGPRNLNSSQAIEPFSSENQSPDDDGVYLQISNLDQWYDEANLRNYLMSQLKPITPILSLSIETPSIAKVRVPSLQVNFHPSTGAIDCHSRLLVCQAGRLASPPQEDGPQADVCVVHEGQNVR